MTRLGTFARVLWCETATLAVVLTGDIPLWLSVLVLGLIPLLGLAPPDAAWVGRLRRVSTLLAGAYLLFFPLDWLYLSERLVFATVHLMFYLKLHSLLHQQNERERARLHLICLFEMLAAASMTVDASFVVPLAAFVLLGSFVLVLEQVRPARLGRRELRAAAATSFSIAVPLLLLSGIVFVSLPRPSQGGFRFGGVMGITTTGFSEEVRLGDFEEIKRSLDVVMRVLSNDGTSPPRWRGAAYDEYEGGEWRRTLSGVSSLPPAAEEGYLLSRPTAEATTRTEILLEPLDTDILFLPPASSRIDANERYLFIDPYWTLRTGRPARAGRYYVVDWHASRPGWTSPVGSVTGIARLSADRRRLYTQIPRLSKRFHDLASQLAREGDLAPLELSRRVETFLESRFSYTLAQPERQYGDPVEDFLFGSRAGHCEYFATAMVLLLRARGVPARLVTGFNRGEQNALGDFEVIRKANAHAWVEVFDEEQTWVAFDPTPPAAAPLETLGGGLLSAGIDSLRMLWDMYVVAYDMERQRDVLGGAGELGESAAASAVRLFARWLAPGKILAALGLGALALVSLARTGLLRRLWVRLPVLRLRRSRQGPAAGPRFFHALLARLARIGIEREEGQTPAEFAGAWEHRLPGLSELTDLYYRARFGGEVLTPVQLSRADRLASEICTAAVRDGGRRL